MVKTVVEKPLRAVILLVGRLNGSHELIERLLDFIAPACFEQFICRFKTGIEQLPERAGGEVTLLADAITMFSNITVEIIAELFLDTGKDT